MEFASLWMAFGDFRASDLRWPFWSSCVESRRKCLIKSAFLSTKFTCLENCIEQGSSMADAILRRLTFPHDPSDCPDIG